MWAQWKCNGQRMKKAFLFMALFPHSDFSLHMASQFILRGCVFLGIYVFSSLLVHAKLSLTLKYPE